MTHSPEYLLGVVGERDEPGNDCLVGDVPVFPEVGVDLVSGGGGGGMVAAEHGSRRPVQPLEDGQHEAARRLSGHDNLIFLNYFLHLTKIPHHF